MKKLVMFIGFAIILSGCFLFNAIAQKPVIEKDSPESVTLNTPVMKQTGVTKLVVKEIRLDWTHNIIWIKVGEEGEAGRVLPLVEYTGRDARTMMVNLNTANLAVKSLNQRIIEKLQADGHLGSGNIDAGP